MTTEEKVLKLKRLSDELGLVLHAVTDPELDTYLNPINVTNVRRIYGVYVANGYVPLEDFIKVAELTGNK